MTKVLINESLHKKMGKMNQSTHQVIIEII